MHKGSRSCAIAFLIVAGLPLLYVSAAGAGTVLGSTTVPLQAAVGPYARVTVVRPLMNFGTFSGMPHERGPRDNAVFDVETNTAVDVRISAGDLTKGGFILETAYTVADVDTGDDLGWVNRSRAPSGVYTFVGDLLLTNAQPAKSVRSYEVNGYARTGPDISSQEAGLYNATITLTVMTP